MAQTSSGSKGTPFLDEQRETKQAKEHNHSTTNLQNQSQTSISMARNNHDETKQVQDSNVVLTGYLTYLTLSSFTFSLCFLLLKSFKQASFPSSGGT